MVVHSTDNRETQVQLLVSVPKEIILLPAFVGRWKPLAHPIKLGDEEMEEITLKDFLNEIVLPEKILVDSFSAAQEIEKITEEFRHQLKLYLANKIERNKKKWRFDFL